MTYHGGAACTGSAALYLLSVQQCAASWSKLKELDSASQTSRNPGLPCSSVRRLCADVAAAGEAAGSVSTSLGWGYTQGVVDAMSAAGGGPVGAGAGLLQVSLPDRPRSRIAWLGNAGSRDAPTVSNGSLRRHRLASCRLVA